MRIVNLRQKGLVRVIAISIFLLSCSIANAEWSIITLPAEMSRNLKDVYFVASNEGWAVGGADELGILSHYKNNTWTVDKYYYPEDISKIQFISTDQGWCIGYGFRNWNWEGVVLRYLDGSWYPETLPELGVDWRLNGLHFVSPDEGWVVGVNFTGNYQGNGVILHYLNGSWAVASPHYYDTSSYWYLNDVCFTSSNEGWAVGFDDTSQEGILLHFSNNNWVPLSPPTGCSNCYFNAVHFPSKNEGWIVGYDESQGVMLHFLNGNWVIVNLPNVSAKWELLDVHFSSQNEGWAVGNDYSNHRGVLLHYSNSSWTSVILPDIIGLESIHFLSSNEGYAVGYDNNGKSILLKYSLAETISPPSVINGPTSGITTLTYSFIVGDSNSSLGDPVKYRIDWGDGNYSDWSSSPSGSHSWTFPGTYEVKAQARCAIHISIVSEWSQSLQVTISGVGPDLTGSWTDLTQTCRTTRQGQKCSVKGTFAVSNIGNRDSSSTYVKFYLSDDGNFDQTDTFLKSFSTGKLKAGKGKNINLNYNLPTGISASGKYVIAVIDPDNLVAETNESINILVFGSIP